MKQKQLCANVCGARRYTINGQPQLSPYEYEKHPTKYMYSLIHEARMLEWVTYKDGRERNNTMRLQRCLETWKKWTIRTATNSFLKVNEKLLI